MAQSEEPDRETLLSLLKEKAKELRASEKKLKKVEEKYVELHKQQKGLLQDRETFIQFLHLVFPQNHLDELLLPEGQYGLYDIDHLRQFWTLYKSQAENENGHIIEVMKEEKKVMYEKISRAEKEIDEKDGLQRRLEEMEAQQ